MVSRCKIKAAADDPVGIAVIGHLSATGCRPVPTRRSAPSVLDPRLYLLLQGPTASPRLLSNSSTTRTSQMPHLLPIFSSQLVRPYLVRNIDGPSLTCRPVPGPSGAVPPPILRPNGASPCGGFYESSAQLPHAYIISAKVAVNLKKHQNEAVVMIKKLIISYLYRYIAIQALYCYFLNRFH